jgi:hypothetical protein
MLCTGLSQALRNGRKTFAYAKHFSVLACAKNIRVPYHVGM